MALPRTTGTWESDVDPGFQIEVDAVVGTQELDFPTRTFSVDNARALG